MVPRKEGRREDERGGQADENWAEGWTDDYLKTQSQLPVIDIHIFTIKLGIQ